MLENLGFWPTFLIGTSQILALMPGVSRSGITITTGRFLRLERDALPAGSVGPFVVGTMAATAVGLIAIDLLLGYLRRHDYTVFVIYRLVLAALIVIVIASGWRSAHF